ncbi:putative receptor-like protein kinase At3g47110 isoform X2 [Pistacia vera]|uniref:putative receptor-like protein kinase At3g47110 isoform X2 n=1 Tax=Pistacia vera TaxID=55513 RepID=UPI001263A238|nr:putative receptor-like protein kinase At3g47110 isoform X2 [Pistacia vera]
MLSSISCPAIPPWCITLLLSCSFVTISANETDRLALLAIKSQLQDPLGFTSSWNSSVSFCLWRGVTCGRRHQRVTKLDLRNQSLAGSLSPYIGNLSFLRSVDLRNNSFYGQIPNEIGRLFRLERLILNQNSLSGTIPTSLSNCSNLVLFFANKNKLTGEIPEEIGHLSNLVRVSLGYNNLKGQLPVSIGNLSALLGFDVKANSLDGRIPDTFGQLRSLDFFNLGQNNFSGAVPPSIYNISSLDTFALLSNRFTGNLPLNINFTLPNLRRYNIHGNDFTGSLPDSLSSIPNIETLDVSDNQLSGKVLTDFSVLKNLSWLNLGDNNLGTGKAGDLDFVTSLTNCSKLQVLGLYHNQFGGLLPHSIANLSTTLTRLAIGANQISGTIPLGLGNLIRLNVIGIESNQLTGNIPEVIGQLKNLQAIAFSDNNLQGSIPSTVGNLTLLNSLWLASNKLQGNIPSSLGNCQNLMLLNISRNKLTEVDKLINLDRLDISRNNFSGEIPNTLGACITLEYLNIQGNSFLGGIPQSLSSLKSIKQLDLSSNNLSGGIPEFVENLSFLEYLNLSYNHFEGEVPKKGAFSNSTKIALAGNEKLCGGLDELHLQPCQSKVSKKLKVPLLKVIIPVILSCLILLSCFIVVCTRRRNSAHNSCSIPRLEEQFPMVSYSELRKATNEFSSSNMIGTGSCGFVYKGILGENGMLVAVKVLNLTQKWASKSFRAECEALRSIRHRNLIKIVTICSSIDFKGADFKALVYEYMPSGSLEKWLHQSYDQLHVSNLSLLQRLNIAIDVASAIEYLHLQCQSPIVHGDLKPSNILLDHDMVARVGDFGLARFLSDRPLSTAAPETQSSTIGIKGTVGYVAPEYGLGSEASTPGDVYSFGILLLEMFTGRRPTDSMFNDGLTLHGFATMALPEKVMEIVEPSIVLGIGVDNSASHAEKRERIEECLISVVRTGVLCSVESPTDRMGMTDVVANLCAARKSFLDSNI